MAGTMNVGTVEAAGDGGSVANGAATMGRTAIPPKFYRIGEVVSYSGVSRQTIHNYTTLGLLHENCWSPGGHRLYEEDVFVRLAIIAKMKAANKTLRDIREHFARQDGLEGAGDRSPQSG